MTRDYTACGAAVGDAPNWKVLVIAIEESPLAARISIALADVGFRVASLAPRGHSVRRLRKVADHFAYHARPRSASTVRAINRWTPDLLICADDVAVKELQILHRQTTNSDDAARRRISKLVEMSIGPATNFGAMLNKSDFFARVQIEEVRSPKTKILPATRAFESVPSGLTYPLVVKADQSYGGRCVRIVNSEDALGAVIWELQMPPSWRYRRLIGSILGLGALRSLMLPLRRTISLQQFITGRASNRAVICWKGKVLAGISVEAIEITHEFGPTSVVRTIDHPEMAMVAERMVKCLELSGFVGFDFILDASQQAWLIEMNPRVTPICHFSLDDGTNLAGALYRETTGRCPPSASFTNTRGLIALFPNELIRCSSSDYLQTAQHDVPWGQPEFVRNVLNRALRTGVRKRVRMFLERRFPTALGVLVKLRLVDLPRNSGCGSTNAGRDKENTMS
jgi:glutathione synthase/RimK-type ligase-like ATP-grasp enzyme